MTFAADGPDRGDAACVLDTKLCGIGIYFVQRRKLVRFISPGHGPSLAGESTQESRTFIHPKAPTKVSLHLLPARLVFTTHKVHVLLMRQQL